MHDESAGPAAANEISTDPAVSELDWVGYISLLKQGRLQEGNVFSVSPGFTETQLVHIQSWSSRRRAA